MMSCGSCHENLVPKIPFCVGPVGSGGVIRLGGGARKKRPGDKEQGGLSHRERAEHGAICPQSPRLRGHQERTGCYVALSWV